MFKKIIALAVLGSPSIAFAQQFDLECIATQNSTHPFGPRLHLQIDFDERKWCRDRCEEVEGFAGIEGGEIVLKDGVDNLGYTEKLIYDVPRQAVVARWASGEAFGREVKYRCKNEEFGEFRPYLGEVVRPRSNIARIFYSKDSRKLSKMVKEGKVTLGFELDISAEGRITDCRIIQPSEVEKLNEGTCALILRADPPFEPARKRTGEPYATTYRSRVTYVGKR
ncbi:energy transducer TonB [Erythrobacter sp. THAF29]|uniref:energy transducer TonB n=1 Tax=Erythrobacter sp. THAF29 TaxID=2587851 RepID=UPI00126931B0|nr:energy transducer TonB [Erythrobacter sp. THAF29]QFT78946.1 Gram-negative bacterial tonB protein [Erythrobacter sp. THAF29]